MSLALDWKVAFETNGYRTTLCFDGTTACEHLENTMFDLVITDMFVNEGRGGLHVIGTLISLKHKAPPVVAVTGKKRFSRYAADSSNYFLDQAHRLGATASIEKPFTALELVQVAETLLQQS